LPFILVSLATYITIIKKDFYREHPFLFALSIFVCLLLTVVFAFLFIELYTIVGHLIEGYLLKMAGNNGNSSGQPSGGGGTYGTGPGGKPPGKYPNGTLEEQMRERDSKEEQKQEKERQRKENYENDRLTRNVRKAVKNMEKILDDIRQEELTRKLDTSSLSKR